LDFICNICGTQNIGVQRFGREVNTCSGCPSTIRTRSLLYMFSMELFGVPLILPDFPILKTLRGMGMTDLPAYADVLAEKFDYKNTFFDEEPKLDISNTAGMEAAALDFLISTEVFEHVRPPVERAFQNVGHLLGPDGILFLTVPYGLHGETAEHFPNLADSGLVHLQGGSVLVNRTAEGELQMFDQLNFHGGPGSTLEMRILTEPSLRRMLLDAGFSDVRLYGENYPPFGICHTENWSLPMAARKQPFVLGDRFGAAFMRQYSDSREALRNTGRMLTQLRSATQHSERELQKLKEDLRKRTEWARDLERQLEERTEWALSLQSELEQHATANRELEREFEDRTRWALELDALRTRLQKELDALRSTGWTRLGRRLRTVR
jgi:SAM-dependent methyltransferase